MAMTSREAMIYQLKNLKGKPLKQKLEHIVTYFWLPILAVMLALVFIVSYIINLTTMKDLGLSVSCINAHAEDGQAESFIMGFAQEVGIDLEQYEVRISTGMPFLDDALTGSYEASQSLFAQIAAQEIDVITSAQNLSNYIYQEAFADLSQILSPEQQSRYEQYYLYMDKALLNSVGETYNEIPEYPDPTKPELMAEPVPVAIVLPETGQFHQLFYSYEQEPVAVGIVVNSKNINNAVTFLEYIME